MNRIDSIKSYYESNMGKGLPDYCVLGWESEEAQYSRFDALISQIELENKTILDVGCGMGSFAEYLSKKNIKAEYCGVDILESMIKCANEKDLDAKFYHCDIFLDHPFENKSFDLVYASGIFNLNLGNNDDFLFKAVKLFFELSKETVAFNLLHCDSPGKEECYSYFRPEEVKEKLLKMFPDKIKGITMVDSYLLNDFTLIMSLVK
jgi:cyclopropane fatty-acyl-phospholipid synthase-like methyltransferase